MTARSIGARPLIGRLWEHKIEKLLAFLFKTPGLPYGQELPMATSGSSAVEQQLPLEKFWLGGHRCDNVHHLPRSGKWEAFAYEPRENIQPSKTYDRKIKDRKMDSKFSIE